MKVLKTLLSAVLAGMCIGFGGVVFLALESKVLGAAHAFQLDTDYHKRRPGRGQAEKKEAV